MKTILKLVFLCLCSTVNAQQDSTWNVFIYKKGAEPKPDLQNTVYNKNGFYLVKNCIYELELKNGTQLSGRVIDISPDHLSITNFFNSNVADKAKMKFDTLSIRPNELKTLKLIADRALRMFNNISLEEHNFIFTKDTFNLLYPSTWLQIFDNDSSNYEIVPNLTAQGFGELFEYNGNSYYFYGGGMIKPDEALIDSSYTKKNGIWLTPCKVEEISGLSIGLYTKNTKNREFGMRDSLLIRGLNIEINPFAVFTLFQPYLSGPHADSITTYNNTLKKDWQVKINGVNLSAVNTINEMQIRGVNVTGLITVVDEIHGVSISGLNTFSYIMSGLTISGIRNRATQAKGCQIALFNNATDLRGFQIGLWNKNGKRSLPIINWQFKKSTKKTV